MEYFKKIEDVFFDQEIIAVLGNFDGCHKGHQELFKAAIKRKKDTGALVLIITFDYNSKDFKKKSIKRIQTLNKKLVCFEKLGVDGVLVLPFTYTFSKIDKKDFLKNILIDQIGITDIIVGHDYRFGYKRLGNVDYLEAEQKNLGYTLTVIPAFKIQGEVVSSSRIRILIEAGEIDSSQHLLGYYPLVNGKVVHGFGVGKTLGFATANLEIDEDQIIPKVGVYGVLGDVLGKKVKGCCNVGYQPTFDRKKRLVVEVNFFNFAKNIYGKNICIHFIKRMRDEIKFNSIKELKSQLIKDQISIENELKKLSIIVK